MNDADIIKALDCCKDSANFQKCTECPYDNDAIGVDCLDKILADAFDLIKRQKAEIEKLKDDNQYLEDRRWKELCEVRAETIKEFAERLKKKTYVAKPYGKYGVVDEYEIDNLVKEMTE